MADTGLDEETWTEISEVLRALGTTAPELAAYRFLHQRSAATPTVIARETGQSRGRIYGVLHSLVERGLCRETPSRPIRYTAVPLTELLPIMISQAGRRLGLLRGAYASLDASPAPAPLPAPSRFRPLDVSLVTGRRAMMTEMRRAANRASSSLLILGSGHLAKRLARSYALLGETRAAAARGVDVTFALGATPELEQDCTFLAEELGADRVHQLPLPGDAAFSILATERFALFALPQPDDDSVDSGDDLGVRIESRAAASVVLQACRAWRRALAKPATAPTLAAHLQEATSRVILVGDHWWSPEFSSSSPLSAKLEALRGRGIDLLAVVTAGRERAVAPGISVATVRFPLVSVLLVDASLAAEAKGSASCDGITKDPAAVARWRTYVETCVAQASPIPQENRVAIDALPPATRRLPDTRAK